MKILSTKRFNKSQKEKERLLSYVVSERCQNDTMEVYNNIMNKVKRAIKSNDFDLAEQLANN